MQKSYVSENITFAVIQAVLGKALAEKYLSGKLSNAELAAATGNVGGFRNMFTARNQEFGNYLNSENQLNAYALYYLFPNLAKVTAILDYCLSRGWLNVNSGFRAADLGCGPGVGVLGLINLIIQNYTTAEMTPVQLTAIDQSAQALRLAGRIVDNLQLDNLKLSCRSADLTDCAGSSLEPQDLIIMANVVNELFRNETESLNHRAELIVNIIDSSLKKDGLFLIIEPALQATSRELHALRDLLLTCDISVVAPCTHQHNCPCNRPENSADWCHEAHYWENPGLIDQIDKITGLNKHHLKYSFLLLCKGKAIQQDNLFYAVASPEHSKGSVKVSACGQGGFCELIYTGKSKSPGNKSFKKIVKGSRFILEGAQAENGRIVIRPDNSVNLEG